MLASENSNSIRTFWWPLKCLIERFCPNCPGNFYDEFTLITQKVPFYTDQKVTIFILYNHFYNTYYISFSILQYIKIIFLYDPFGNFGGVEKWADKKFFLLNFF